MRKSKKLNFSTFANKFVYYAFAKVRREINGKVYNGYIYKLCNKLAEQEKEELKQNYNNILIGGGCYEYAPEIKFDTIFIAHSLSKARMYI